MSLALLGLSNARIEHVLSRRRVRFWPYNLWNPPPASSTTRINHDQSQPRVLGASQGTLWKLIDSFSTRLRLFFAAFRLRIHKSTIMAAMGRLGFLATAVIFHLVYIYSIFDIYFVSPIVSGMQLVPVDRPANTKSPANRLVLFVGTTATTLSILYKRASRSLS